MYPAPFRRSCHCGGHTNAGRVRRVRATPRQRAIPSSAALRLPPRASAVTTSWMLANQGRHATRGSRRYLSQLTVAKSLYAQLARNPSSGASSHPSATTSLRQLCLKAPRPSASSSNVSEVTLEEAWELRTSAVTWLSAYRSSPTVSEATLPFACSPSLMVGGTPCQRAPSSRWFLKFRWCLKSPCLRISIFPSCVWKHRAHAHPLPMVSEVTLLSAYQSSPIVSGSTAPTRILFQWCLKSPCFPHINLRQLCLEAPRPHASSSNGV